MQEQPEGSTGSGFKESQKTGQRFKVSSYILGEPGVELRTPGYMARDLCYYPLHHGGPLDLVLLHKIVQVI